MALDLATGAIRWTRQVTANDVYISNCRAGNPNCPETVGPDHDFGSPPVLARAGSRDLIVIGQKSGMAFAMDPEKKGEIVWQVPAGTAEAQAPLGLESHLPIPIGTLAIGGPITTAGGVTFRAATTDPYLRAYDNATGAVLWQAKLPTSAAGTPMTYVSPRTGKQYVVVVAGGARVRGPAAANAPKADYVIAYALK